jgi:hypothetical protein
MRRAGDTNFLCHRTFPSSSLILLEPTARSEGDEKDREERGGAEGGNRDSLVYRRLRQLSPQRAANRSEDLTGETGQTEQAQQVEQAGQFEQGKQAEQIGQTEQIEQAVRYRNPIAESLWPTAPEPPATSLRRWGGNLSEISAGPFHHWRLPGRAPPWGRGLQSPRLPRYPNNLYAANGFPVSAYS